MSGGTEDHYFKIVTYNKDSKPALFYYRNGHWTERNQTYNEYFWLRNTGSGFSTREKLPETEYKKQNGIRLEVYEGTVSFLEKEDNDKPVVTGLPANGWTNEHLVYFSASDRTTKIYDIVSQNAKCRKVRNVYELQIENETTVDLYVYDEVLNVTHKVIKTDYTAPELFINYPSSEEWQNEDVTLDLMVEDELSGIKRITVFDEFTDLDCKPFKSNAEGAIWKERSYKITGTGKHNIRIEAEDYAGNINRERIAVLIRHRI